MIEFLGLCVENLIRSIKYALTGQLRFSEIISKARAYSILKSVLPFLKVLRR